LNHHIDIMCAPMFSALFDLGDAADAIRNGAPITEVHREMYLAVTAQPPKLNFVTSNEQNNENDKSRST
jgi:hypothetical protein